MAQYGIVASTKSTYIHAALPLTNFGGSGSLSHRALFGASIESFVGFDILANVPLGSAVASATAKYQKTNVVTGTIRLRAIVDAWSENVITWLKWVVSGRNVSTAFVDLAVSAKGDYNFDVKDIVQEIVDNQYAGEGFYAVRTDAINNIATFASDDDATEAARPELTVVYTPPTHTEFVPTPQPLLGPGPEDGGTPPPLQRVSVQSSHISAVRYDEARRMLEVEFKGGQLYLYQGVPRSEYDAFLAAGSKGGYFAKRIKGVYSATKGGIS